MLKPSVCLALLLLLSAVASVVHAQQDDMRGALRSPERVTVDINDQFLGQLAVGDKTLYFVSNSATRKEIYRQNIENGVARRVFDDGSEVTWPRVSPDGHALLYISFSKQATGQLCVRDLPDATHQTCLQGAGAALQAEWIDKTRMILVDRMSIEGDLRVSEVTLGDTLSSRTLYNKNWTSPAVSPNGRWLVYVPLERVSKSIGPGFAARAEHRLEAVRLDRAGIPRPIEVDLPGSTGQPVFDRSGRYLYFVQFFSDSNHDGLIDARDHGVLFRLPFPSDTDDAPAGAARATPLQLTNAAMNCQYPAPAAHRLVATCTRTTDLDIYELPLDGVIPSNWSLAKVRGEAELATRQTEQLLLGRHQLALETDLKSRRLLLMHLAITHLELDEFDAADFYARKLAKLRAPGTRGIGQPLRLMIEHRRLRAQRERGRNVEKFTAEARGQIEKLRDDPKDTPVARVMNRVVRSEIADSIGDKLLAKQELESVELDDTTPSTVIEAYYTRVDAFYREIDDRDALVTVCRRLAKSGALGADERLDYARAAARALVRGRPFNEAEAVLVRERAAQPDDTEYGFALDLARVVLAIRHEPTEALKAQLTTLYDAQQRPARRRAVVFDAVQRAAEVGADTLVEAIAERYLDDVAAQSQEMRRASRLYQRALLGRAFRFLAEAHYDRARADFDAVTRRTDSFEAAVGSIDLRLQEGQSPATIQAELLTEQQKQSPLASFVKAYLVTRSLASLRGEAHSRALDEVHNLMRASWATLKNKGEVRALYGALLHDEYLHTGAQATAEAANVHYMIALELLQKNPRYRAKILGQLGLLHSRVGNYRIALGYLEQRAKLPFIADQEELAVRLATARALLHVDRENESAAMSEKALGLVQRTPALAEYRALALDRAALHNLAASHFARALSLYDLEMPLLDSSSGAAARRNRFVVRLARAAAAVGAGQSRRALADLNAIEPSLDESEFIKALISPHVTPQAASQSYRAIVAGLRASANRALGQLPETARALERRHAALVQHFAQSARDEDMRALTLVETQLAANASMQHDANTASKWLKLALEHTDVTAAYTQARIERDQLSLLWVGAELNRYGHALADSNIDERVAAAQSKLVELDNPEFKTYERWFEIYLALSQSSQLGAAKSESFRKALGSKSKRR